MSDVEVIEDTYACPHCEGKILLSRQFNQDGNPGSVYLYHIDKDGNKEEIKWIRTEL
jgi:hypothetical protein